MTIDELIGERVHQEMWRARTTQIALAEHLGMQQSSLSRKLRGTSRWLASEVVAVAAFYDVDPAVLLRGLGT